jgi:hypothetical protein
VVGDDVESDGLVVSECRRVDGGCLATIKCLLVMLGSDDACFQGVSHGNVLKSLESIRCIGEAACARGSNAGVRCVEVRAEVAPVEDNWYAGANVCPGVIA